MTREEEIVEAIWRAASNGSGINVSTIEACLTEMGFEKPDSWKVAVQRVLRTMVACKLLRSEDDEFYLMQRVNGADGNGGDGNGGPPGVPPPPQDGNAGPGAGFRELLAHPYLLTIEEERFRELLDNIGGLS